MAASVSEEEEASEHRQRGGEAEEADKRMRLHLG